MIGHGSQVKLSHEAYYLSEIGAASILIWRCFLFAASLWIAPTPQAQAGFLLENNLFYLSSGLKTSDNETIASSHYSAFLGATFPKIYFIGWNIALTGGSIGVADGTSKISGTEMGPKFGIWLGKNKFWSVSLAYHPLVTGTHSSISGTSLKLQGSGYQFQLGFTPQISKTLFAGIAIIYDAASYSQKTDSDNLTTTVSYSRTNLMPTIYLSWRFGQTN